MNKKQEQMTNHRGNGSRKKFGVTFDFLVVIIFLLICCFFFTKAVMKRSNHVNLAKQTQKLYNQTNVISAQRGTIYDDNNQALAENTSTFSVYAVLSKSQKSPDGKPNYVTDPKKTAKVLSENLPISYRKALKILTPAQPGFQVEFGNPGKNISLADKEKIESHHLPGINFTQQQARLYTNGVFASHIIGLASPVTNMQDNSTTLVGQLGLEKSFNKMLTGHDGYKQVRRDLYGAQLPNKSAKQRPAVNGDNVHTTLNSRLQLLLENQLSLVQSQVHPKELNAIVMDAKTGEVVAASQRPTFNPSTGKGLGNVWRNTLTQDAYEPGSTMKIFTLASSIDSGHFKGNDTYLSGQYKIDGKIVPDWLRTGWGQITYDKGFALSSNVAMAHLEQQMGPATWGNYMNRFRFTKNTNSVFGDDDSGSKQFQVPIEQANTAFGQGIQVTVLQMAQALTAIANNGKMIKPRFVTSVTNANNTKVVKNYNEQVIGHPIKPSTAKAVRKHMEDVVYKPYGIGHDYQLKGYKVAAKTGTAQVAGPNGYGNGDDSYLYSVAGMVPASHPRYIMYVTMKQPQLNGKKTPTQFMAEIFNPVMKQALKQNPGSSGIPDLVNQPTKTAEKILKTKKMSPVVVGKGDMVIKQTPTPVGNSESDGKVMLLTSGNPTMPDMNGWNKEDALSLGELLNLKLKVTGNGRVADQSIKPDQPINVHDQLVINLK